MNNAQLERHCLGHLFHSKIHTLHKQIFRVISVSTTRNCVQRQHHIFRDISV